MNTEELKGILDYFKTALNILHGVGSPIKICLLVFIFAIVLLWIVLSGLLEFAKKVKEKHKWLASTEKKLPRFFRFLYSGKVRFFLLVVVILLFAIDWRDATTISPPIIKAPSAPIVQFTEQRVQQRDNSPTSRKLGIRFEQNRLSPQVIRYASEKTANLDRPGVSVILTASGELRHPLFKIRCSVPCLFSQGTGLSTAFLAHLVKDKSTDVSLAMQLDIPGKLSDGEQVEMDFRSQSDKEVKIESVILKQQ